MNLRAVQGCRAKEVRWKRDGVGGGTARIAVESPSCQIRQESWLDLINLETRVASQPVRNSTPGPVATVSPASLHPRLIACGLTTLSRLSNYLGFMFRRPRFFQAISILYFSFSPPFMNRSFRESTNVTQRKSFVKVARPPMPIFECNSFTEKIIPRAVKKITVKEML